MQAALDKARDKAQTAKEIMQSALDEAQQEKEHAKHTEEQQHIAQAAAEKCQAEAAQHARLAAESQLAEALQSNKEVRLLRLKK